MIKISDLNTQYSAAFNKAADKAQELLNSKETLELFTDAASQGIQEVYLTVPLYEGLASSIVVDAVQRELHSNGFKAIPIPPENRTYTLFVTWDV